MAAKVLEIWKDREYMIFESGDIYYEGDQDNDHFSTAFANAITAVKTSMTTNNVNIVHWETSWSGVSFKHETSTTGVVTASTDVSDSIFANLGTYATDFWTNYSATFVDQDQAPDGFEHGGH